MSDPRIDKLAHLLVDYSVEVKPGEVVSINSTPEAAELVQALYREVLLHGGHPLLRLNLEGIDEIFFKYASDEQLDFVSEVRKFEIEHLDAQIGIGAPANLRELSGIDPKRIGRRRKVLEPLMKRYMLSREEGGIKWVGFDYPTNALAQEAGMSLSDFRDFVFQACMPEGEDPVSYWRKVHDDQERLKEFLEKVEELHFEGPEMDLKMKVKGRKWINCDGKINMPDGEIFTGPVEDSAEGFIFFEYPSEFFGKPVEGIKLEFSRGEVVNFKAEKGEENLKAALEIDPGARRIGEISFGTNFGIQICTKNTLFDEKIGGTIHLALGNSYSESGGKNESAIHWDMVREMKNGSRVTADGKVIYENGNFLIF
ncbi:MAG: aminopeptidase [Caldiserica bacterium]|jgi:aminopeptidase|nr:aminopeptidase [Caldisericota bacterium]MDH7562070.1 aminopeptidase [Caldisericota bacterium]